MWKKSRRTTIPKRPIDTATMVAAHWTSPPSHQTEAPGIRTRLPSLSNTNPPHKNSIWHQGNQYGRFNSILTEALRTCEHFAILPGNEDIDESSSSSPSSLQYDEANHSLGLPSSFFSYSNNEDDAATFHLPPLPTLYRRHHIPVRSSCTFSQAM